MESTDDQLHQPEPIDRRRMIFWTISSLLVFALCLFVPAGTLEWVRGWLFCVVMLGGSVVVTLYLRRVNPDVIAGRINPHRGTKRWDRILIATFLPALIAIPVVAALDDGRFHWLPVPWWVCALGYALVIIGMVGVTWAESVNKFFEPTVRIQTDRGHKVIDTGPYAIVRHPGYVAAFLLFTGMPLALGSIWALIPAGLSFPSLVVRTILEDRTLREELPGYQKYAQMVRYRLVPGVW
jgi:protein-S-isoprenylcysteine O-methyltransferase Ste14